MAEMHSSLVLFFVIVYLTCVSSFDLQQHYIPTQEHFVAQQSHALLHHKSHGLPNNPSFGWPSPGIGQGGYSATSSANAASAFSYGPFGTSGINPQQQNFGGLGFGTGGSWYPFPYSYPLLSNQQGHGLGSSGLNPGLGSPGLNPGLGNPGLNPDLGGPGLNLGLGPGSGRPFELPLPFPNSQIPTVLKPSTTGWDTSYNVPCGSYRIRPFVNANLRLATGTSSSPFQGRKKRSSNDNYGYENGNRQSASIRSIPSYFPYNPGFREPKKCSWDFNSDGPCKLKFRCVWFQLPALFSCSENYMQVTDATSYLNSTFCGNRKPRKVYNSSSGKLILTFRSQTSSLPAVFDCMVTCTPEASPNDAGIKPKPQSHVVPLVKDQENNSAVLSPVYSFTNSTTEDNSSDTSTDTTRAEKPRIRIGACKCGVQEGHYSSRGRIVGGSPATPAEYSWTAALVRKSSASRNSRSARPFCGGSLISDRYVITAAHCVQSNNIVREPRSNGRGDGRNPGELFDVLLIEHNINRLDDVPGGSIRIGVDKVVVHPKYNKTTFNYDVALIRLQKPIDFPNAVYPYDTYHFHSQRHRFLPEIEARPIVPKPTPICLPPDKEVSLEDKYGIITGWGKQNEGGIPSDELLKATIQIFNATSCKELYKEYNYPVTESMMCAGYLAGKVDACEGDSGGGLMIRENEKYYLVGITSWGRGCGRKNQPGVYTRIPGLTGWIRSVASDGLWCV